MGFNPYRKHHTGVADYALLAAAVLLAVGLMLWGFLG